ncbi:MAG: NUDIX domain-containing protein [Nanoarchaeota archaeon]|nr:NUDIX domain-containing protein [Nanoarchaeota archaeon]
MNFALATKAFIIKDNKLLLVKRQPHDIQNPNIWELPGGRLNPGENPHQGLKREIKEETNLDIKINQPLNIQHFTRKDGQIITMIIFVCQALTNEIKLSSEHAAHQWVPLKQAKDHLAEFFHKEVDIFSNLN